MTKSAMDFKPPKKRLLTLRVSEDEYNQMVAKSILFANGNVSKWIRYSSTKLEPKYEAGNSNQVQGCDGAAVVESGGLPGQLKKSV